MWDPFGVGSSTYTFNWLQNYPRLLDPANDHPVMRVQSPLPCYWRASSLDSFTGDGWVTAQAFLLQLEVTEQTDGLYTYAAPDTELMPPGETVDQEFEVWGFQSNYFLVGGDPRTLVIDQELPVRMNAMRALRVSTPLEPVFTYSVHAVIPVLRPADLVGLGNDYPDELDRYLLLPFGSLGELANVDTQEIWTNLLSDYGPDGWEWTDLYALSKRIVGDASDPYHKTLRIERYLRQFYVYSLHPPESDYTSPYAAFLFDTHTGYCQHFAGAMAILLRFNGIPARVALGFTAGKREDDGAYVVSWNDAHAWVEAYFDGVGWVMFDPTPGRNIPFAGASSTTPGFISPFVENTTPTPDTPTTSAPRPVTTGPDETDPGVVTREDRGWLDRHPWAPWVAGFVVVVAGWPVVRGLWKRRRLYRGRPEERLEASLALLRDDLADYGVPATRAHTLEETLGILQRHIGLHPDHGLVERAEAVLYGGRRARPQDVGRAEALRAEVKRRLQKRHGWLRTLFAWYGVPGPAHRSV
jgi:transglutaminase-like putative cysteine protease